MKSSESLSMVMMVWIYMVSCDAGICDERPGVPTCTDILEGATGLYDKYRLEVPMSTYVQKVDDTMESMQVRTGVPKCTNLRMDAMFQD